MGQRSDTDTLIWVREVIQTLTLIWVREVIQTL